ncbi:hypothetical protein TcCL_Unassigned03306 [Trypanosoma cruzi]|nr:hypothetical protein TcCL_Unassigned03306 [Trypanosoma cruzi]
MPRQLQLLSKNSSAHVPATQNATSLTGRTLPKSRPQHIGNIQITGYRPPSSRDAAPWQHVSAATHARSYRSQQHLMCSVGCTTTLRIMRGRPPLTHIIANASQSATTNTAKRVSTPPTAGTSVPRPQHQKQKSSAEASRHAHLHTHGIEPLPSYAWSSRDSNKGYKGTRNPCHPRSQKHKARNTPQLGHGTSEHRGRRR